MEQRIEAPTTTNQEGRFSFSFTGTGIDLALLMLKNAFFTIFTLGIYRPWAKTNTRRYIWEHVHFLGDRATYVGTGQELFIGWCKLGVIVAVLFALMGMLPSLLPKLAMVSLFVAPFIYIFMFSVAAYSGFRYRLARTLWRQVRFGVDRDKSSARSFIFLYFKGVILSILSLGVFYPVFKNQMRTFLTNRSRLGTAYFGFDGKDVEYLLLCLKGVLLSVLTLGIYFPFFLVQMTKYRFDHTTFQGARFNCTLSASDIFKFGLVSYLLAIVTLGLAIPWIYSNGLKMVTESLYLVGTIDLGVIQSKASDGNALGDEFAAEYDLDLGF